MWFKTALLTVAVLVTAAPARAEYKGEAAAELFNESKADWNLQVVSWDDGTIPQYIAPIMVKFKASGKELELSSGKGGTSKFTLKGGDSVKVWMKDRPRQDSSKVTYGLRVTDKHGRPGCTLGFTSYERYDEYNEKSMEFAFLSIQHGSEQQKGAFEDKSDGVHIKVDAITGARTSN